MFWFRRQVESRFQGTIVSEGLFGESSRTVFLADTGVNTARRICLLTLRRSRCVEIEKFLEYVNQVLDRWISVSADSDHLIFFSSVAVTQKDNEYSREKILVESLLRNRLHSRRYTILRIANVFGPNPTGFGPSGTILCNLSLAIKKNQKVKVDHVFFENRSFIHVYDLNNWLFNYMLAANESNRTLTVVCEREYTYKSIFEKVSMQLDREDFFEVRSGFGDGNDNKLSMKRYEEFERVFLPDRMLTLGLAYFDRGIILF